MTEKIADYLLDISKLILAGVVLTVLLEIQNLSGLTVLLVSINASVFAAVTGFLILREK